MKRRFLALPLLLVLIGFVWIFRREEKVIRNQPVTAWTEDQRADCAVVLTGGPGRVHEGFDLLAQGQVKKLIVSGVHPRSNLRDIFPLWPFYSGLREDDVVLEKRSATTYGNAEQSLPLVEALHCRSIVLVTSHLHMYRAFKTFRRIYPPEILILKHSISSGYLPPREWDVGLETTKTLFYSLWAF